MVENIYKLKNKILQHVEEKTQDMQRININEVKELVDMVKDLADAEKNCWEASYYRAVTEAMEGKSGYGSSSASSGNMGNMGGGGRQGYNQPMRQGYGSMGHTELIDKLGEEYRNMAPEERMMMKNKVLSTLGSM